MDWANFLHLYQPASQQPDILEDVVRQSYRPLLERLADDNSARLTLNVTGALLELFDKYHYSDLIDLLRKAGSSRRVEFTASAKYHALLPFLSERDIIRQITENDKTNRFYLGESYQPQGFFPPEMAYDANLAPVLDSLGFSWVILDEIALNGKVNQIDYSQTYQIKGTNLKVFFRERRLSNLIMSAAVRDAASLKEVVKNELKTNRYAVTAMDGETFGHHRPGLENLLFSVFEDKAFNLVTLSELADKKSSPITVTPVTSTWATSEQNIEDQTQFVSWKDPHNEIHTLQWQLFEEANKIGQGTPQMDQAEASDHFYWASGKPWWSTELIEDGAYRLKNIAQTKKADELYQKIIALAFDWQRTGLVRKWAQERKSKVLIPYEGADIDRALFDLLARAEKKAAGKGEYESAIMWRDAAYKLQHKSEAYDLIYVIDLLKANLGEYEVEKIVTDYLAKFRKIRSGQPEQRD